MPTSERSHEQDARALLIGILSFFYRHHRWPISADVNDLSSYKRTKNKAAAVRWLIEQGWLCIDDAPSTSTRPKRVYSVTEFGRVAVAPPMPLPKAPGPSHPFPEDSCERLVYAHNLFFYKRHGRWPTGEERAGAFYVSARSQYSPARRRRAVENLINDGEVVRVTFTDGRRERTCLIEPREAPEYADKNGWIFYGRPEPRIEIEPEIEPEIEEVDAVLDAV